MGNDSVCSYMDKGGAHSALSLDCGASCLSNQAEINLTYAPNDVVGKDALQPVYLIMTAVMSVMSVVGSLLIIFYYWRIPQLRNKSRELLVYLSICDLMIAAGNLLGISWLFYSMKHHPPEEITTDSVCIVQAVISSGFSIASFFWTTFIAANVFLTVVYNSKKLATKYRWLLHTISWGVSTTVVVITLLSKRFGYNPCLDLVWWCWITPKDGDARTTLIMWEIISGKAWEILSYLLVCMLYTIVKIKLARHMVRVEASLLRSGSGTHSRESSAYISAQKKLTYIPLVFMIGRIWGTLRFFLDIDMKAEIVGDYIAILQGVGDSSQGFFNFLVIVLTTPQLKEKFRCFCPQREEQLIPNSLSHHDREDSDDVNDSSDSDLGIHSPRSVQYD